MKALLTVPATDQSFMRERMEEIAGEAGFPAENVTLLPEPVAAEHYYASRDVTCEGEILLVYDLGGGTFDTALLK